MRNREFYKVKTFDSLKAVMYATAPLAQAGAPSGNRFLNIYRLCEIVILRTRKAPQLLQQVGGGNLLQRRVVLTSIQNIC